MIILLGISNFARANGYGNRDAERRKDKVMKKHQKNNVKERQLTMEEVTAIWEAMCEVSKMPDAKSFFDD